MARVTSVFISGVYGNVVMYHRMGKPFSRMKRNHIKQTAATKLRGINFGIASRAGKALRTGLSHYLPNPTDRSMQSRFSGAIAKWLGLSDVNTLPPTDAAIPLNTFQFTKGATFRERFKVPVSVTHSGDGTITVSIGAFVPVSDQVVTPAGTVSILCTIAVAGCLPAKGAVTGNHTQSFTIPYNTTPVPARQIQFAIPLPPGSLTVTAARLDYFCIKNGMITNMHNKAFMPAGIIDAFYKG